VEAGTPAGFDWDKEHMDVLGYHMQTITPDFRNKRRCSVVGCHRRGPVRIRLGCMRAVTSATSSAPDRVPMCPACQCGSARRHPPHLPSLTLAALVIFHHRPFLCSVPFRFTWITIIPKRTIRFTRSRYLGHALQLRQGTAGLLAISPPKRVITLERPVSMRFGYPPAISGLAI
jgi:hypothetical protein